MMPCLFQDFTQTPLRKLRFLFSSFFHQNIFLLAVSAKYSVEGHKISDFVGYFLFGGRLVVHREPLKDPKREER
jgi:hypothetical protein